jgi:hypothetical protein
MSEAIIVALITGACAIVANLIISRQSSKELYAKLDKQSELSDTKIQGEIDVIKNDIRALSNRVEAHNKIVERTYELERKSDVHEEQIKVANHRIEDLEKKGA